MTNKLRNRQFNICGGKLHIKDKALRKYKFANLYFDKVNKSINVVFLDKIEHGSYEIIDNNITIKGTLNSIGLEKRAAHKIYNCTEVPHQLYNTGYILTLSKRSIDPLFFDWTQQVNYKTLGPALSVNARGNILLNRALKNKIGNIHTAKLTKHRNKVRLYFNEGILVVSNLAGKRSSSISGQGFFRRNNIDIPDHIKHYTPKIKEKYLEFSL